MNSGGKRPVSDLEAHTGYWLRAVSNHVSQAFARKLEERGVTVAEWVLMRALYEVDALAPSRLAETLGMTRGAITKLADRLIIKNLAARAPDPGDARAQTLALTTKGRRLTPDLAALADQNDSEFFAPLSEADRAALMRLLQTLARAHDLRSAPTE